MQSPFICCYSDILFTPDIVRRLLDSPDEIALAIDVAWLERYQFRSEHPPDDAEKVVVFGRRIACIDRRVPPEKAYGEYIGVAKFSAEAASRLIAKYHRCRTEFQGRPWREAKSFEAAYKIQLLQEMIECGEHIGHVDTSGGYIEVDTQQDLDYAIRNWTSNLQPV